MSEIIIDTVPEDIGAFFVKKTVTVKDSHGREVCSETVDLIPIGEMSLEEISNDDNISIIELVTFTTLKQIIDRQGRFDRADEVKAKREILTAEAAASDPGFGWNDTPRTSGVGEVDLELTVYDLMAAHPGRIWRLANKDGEAPALSHEEQNLEDGGEPLSPPNIPNWANATTDVTEEAEALAALMKELESEFNESQEDESNASSS
jgi:hypothetical protein